MNKVIDKLKTTQFINSIWDNSIVPTLMEYIKIPNKSPMFDPEWQANGYMDQAAELIRNWADNLSIPNMQIEIVRLEGKTPLLFIEIPGTSQEDTVLLYGHFDKQPEMKGWDADLHPWKPVLKGNQLFGRGGADDGYAVFASLTAINALHEQNIPHARCVILIEGSEESGSIDLPFYIDALKEKIGKPSLVVCLDSGCGNYEQLWVTTSLRGATNGVLTVEVLSQGIHSGTGSGIVPSCFRILRQLLNRLEDEKTGDVKLEGLYVDIPTPRMQQANAAAEILQEHIYEDLPLLKNVQPDSTSMPELILRRTWKSALSIIGCEGIPSIKDAGNVTLPSLSVKLSMRLAPTLNAKNAALLIKNTLEKNPPQNARVTYKTLEAGSGWHAPLESPWLQQAVQIASQTFFGKDAMYMGEGGSIPFMGMLGEKFPNAQFVITGLLGPASNAHGPNEFLHIPMGKKLTACIAFIIAEHFKTIS